MRLAARVLIFAGIALVTMNADCDRNVTKDPSFRDWCGDHLCAWAVDQGQIARVPTWDPNDFGVSFLGDAGTQISQLTVESQASCLLFTSVGNLTTEAQMTISADFDNDGTIDYSDTLASAEWTQVQTEITAPAVYRGITFYLTKRGAQDAVLAQLRVQASSGCTAAAPVLSNLAIGDVCSKDTDCTAGSVCHPTDGGPGICSTCAEGGCTAPFGCTQMNPNMPFQCAPGAGGTASGSPCLRGADCQSGFCDGARPTPVALDAGSCDLETLGDSVDNCKSFGAFAGVCR